MSAWELETKQTAIISNIKCCDKMSLRLMSVGFVNGKDITILQKHKQSSLVKIGSLRIMLSSCLLQNITIK